MAKLRNPVLFSEHFGIDPKKLVRLGIFDPILNADTKLFIDPLLLRHSHYKVISKSGVADFEAYFAKIIRLLQASTIPGDVAWRNAERLFRFDEPQETCLGYGDRTIHGSAIGPTLRLKLMKTAKEIIDLGVSDPELFALLGLLEDGIGADRISDITTHTIRPALIRFNTALLPELRIATEEFQYGDERVALVRNPFEAESRKAVLLVPTDILRELPIAHDWSDVADAAAKNARLRDRVNQRIGNIWVMPPKRTRRKRGAQPSVARRRLKR